jgi:probable HAF family extracellular repeat protein
MNRIASMSARWALGILVSIAATASQAAHDWTVVELTADSAAGGTARDVNNRGQVVGQTFVQTGPLPFGITPHAFLWQNGERTDIGSAAGQSSVASAINASGTIVGTVDRTAYEWVDGQPISLNLAGNATGINNAGEIIGDYWTGGALGSGQDNPFKLSNGVFFELPTLGGSSNAASAINNRGDVVGYAMVDHTASTHAALWQAQSIQDLGTLGGINSFATRVNEAGVIVGRAQAANGAYYMARWSVNGGPVENLMPGGSPTGLNNRGDIVGNNINTGAPFLYEDGNVTNLLELDAMRAGGWTAFSPFAINDRGWIVGNAWKPGAPFWGTAILLIPK